MPVSFSNIPQSWKIPLYWLEFDNSMAGFPVSRLPSLMFGTMLSAASATADVPVLVSSVADGQNQFGLGSMLDGMVQRFFKNNFATELWVIPLAEPGTGVAATGSITVNTGATEAGTLPIYIGGRMITVGVAAGDSAATIAAGLAAEINDDDSQYVIAANPTTGSAVVNLTCKWKGLDGNDIDIRAAYGGPLAGEAIPVGVTLTIANNGKLSGGSGTPSLTNAIANMGDESYEYVAMPWTDSTSLTAIEYEYGFGDDGRWGWMRQLYGHVFCARRGSGTGNGGVSGLMSWGPNNNSGLVSVMGIETNSPTPNWEWAAAYTAKAARALLNDPARPLQTLTLDGCLPAPKHQRFRMTDLNNLAGVGIATQRVNGDGIPSIVRETTTYQLNLYGQGDDSYELVTTLATLAAFFRNQRQAITSKYPRHKLADDGTRFGAGQAIVTPNIIKAELVAEYRVMEFNGLVENGDAYKANLIVERDPNNPNRVNVLSPPDLVNQLRIFAVLGQFRLQYDRGIDTQISGVATGA